MLLEAYTGEILTATATLAVQAVYGLACPRLQAWAESRRHKRRAKALALAAQARVPEVPPADTWAAESAPARAARVRSAPAQDLDAGACESAGPALLLAGLAAPKALAPPRVSRAPPVAAPPPDDVFERVPVLRVPLKPHLEMRPIDHLREFLACVRDTALGKHPKTGRWECRRDSAQWLKVYHAWAESRAIKTIPEWQFLGLLAEQAGVEKSRDRLKDAQGRVIKKASGSPERSYFYTVFEVVAEEKSGAARGSVRRAA